jgi:hypothetical protein
MALLNLTDGGPRAAIPFRAVWCLDCEYHAPDGERQ